MLRSLVVVPFALLLGLVIARAEAQASAEREPACPAQCDACDTGTCTIECAPGSSCAAETVTCPSGMNCAVECNGDASCRAATIVAPNGHDLELTCTGPEACEDATLQCGAGLCGWACATTGSCHDLTVE